MSWAEVKKINSDLSTPLDELIKTGVNSDLSTPLNNILIDDDIKTFLFSHESDTYTNLVNDTILEIEGKVLIKTLYATIWCSFPKDQYANNRLKSHLKIETDDGVFFDAITNPTGTDSSVARMCNNQLIIGDLDNFEYQSSNSKINSKLYTYKDGNNDYRSYTFNYNFSTHNPVMNVPSEVEQELAPTNFQYGYKGFMNTSKGIIVDGLKITLNQTAGYNGVSSYTDTVLVEYVLLN